MRLPHLALFLGLQVSKVLGVEQDVNEEGKSSAAPPNIQRMSTTLETSQSPIGWLKAFAFKNMLSMLVTRATSHFEMSLLKGVLENILFMSVMNVFDVREESNTYLWQTF